MVKYILLLLLITQMSSSQEIEKSPISNQITLTIIPHICIAPRGAISCISKIDIIWNSTYKGNYCLNSNLAQKMLTCWENADEGSFQHKVVYDQNIIYKILDSYANERLAQATMIFKKMKPQRQYNKRHKRFPWSINAL